MAFNSLNQVNIIGNLAREWDRNGRIDLRKITPEGRDETHVLSFPVAVSGAGNNRDEPGYFQVTCWGKAAVAVREHLKKGSKVCVTGSLRSSSYRPEGADKDVYQVEIANSTVYFLDSNGNGNRPAGDDAASLAAQASAAPAAPAMAQEDDGIPF